MAAFSDNDYIDFRSSDNKWYPALIMHESKSNGNASILYKKHNKVIIEDVKLMNNPNVKPPHSHTMQIVAHCQNLPQTIGIEPIYFYDSSQQKDFIMIAMKHSLQAYDIENDEFIALGCYPYDFGEVLIYDSHLIIPGTSKYVTFGVRSRSGVFPYMTLGNVNLNIEKSQKQETLEMEYQDFHQKYGPYHPMSTLIHGNLHIFGFKGSHLMYDFQTSELKRLRSFGINHKWDSSIKIVHMEKLQKVFFFGDDYANCIWYFDYSLDPKQCEFEYKVYKLSMPRIELNTFCVVKACDTMIILFYYGDSGSRDGEHDIYFLDLIGGKWYKSEKKYNYSARIKYQWNDRLYVVCTRDNALHFVCDKYHFKSRLIDIVPHELKEIHALRHGLCVDGYLRGIDELIPRCLCDLIKMFSSNLF